MQTIIVLPDSCCLLLMLRPPSHSTFVHILVIGSDALVTDLTALYALVTILTACYELVTVLTASYALVTVLTASYVLVTVLTASYVQFGRGSWRDFV